MSALFVALIILTLIPLAPDITALSNRFQITQVSLGDIVTIAFSFPVSVLWFEYPFS